MATFQSFEEIEAWQLARQLTRELYRMSNSGELGRDFGLRDQIRRAAISVMANIAEGYERGGTGEFIQFLSVAKSSAAEVRSHLYVALDQDYIKQAQFDQLVDLTMQVGRKTGALMRYLRQANIRGAKYR